MLFSSAFIANYLGSDNNNPQFPASRNSGPYYSYAFSAEFAQDEFRGWLSNVKGPYVRWRPRSKESIRHTSLQEKSYPRPVLEDVLGDVELHKSVASPSRRHP